MSMFFLAFQTSLAVEAATRSGKSTHKAAPQKSKKTTTHPSAAKSIKVVPIKPQQSLEVQQQLKKIDTLEDELARNRTEWYEKARDIAFLEQITAEAQLTQDLDVAAQGTRLIFLEEYGGILAERALHDLVDRDANSIRGVTYNQTEIANIRDRGHELMTAYRQRQLVLRDQMKRQLTEIVAAADKLYELRAKGEQSK